MRRRSISTATALAVLFSSAALTVTAAGTASAAASVAAPGGMVAHAGLQRVFVADRSGGTITVADWSGALIKKVSGVPGVTGLVLSDDGSTLYAAAEGSHEVVAFDAGSLAVTGRWTIDTTEGPRGIAFTAGKVWFSYGDQWDGNLGSIDPNWTAPEPPVEPTEPPVEPVEPPVEPTEPPVEPPVEPTEPPVEPPVEPTEPPAEPTEPAPAELSTASEEDGPVRMGLSPHGSMWYDPADLDTDPSSPGLLAMGEVGISTGSVSVLDVSSGTPEVVAHHGGNYSLTWGIGDIDLVPGGSQVLINGNKRLSYANGTFADAGGYPVTGYQADVNRDGTVANFVDDTISVYAPNGTQPLRTLSAGGTTADVTWAPDASRLFALVASNGTYTLKAFTGPKLNVPTLTVSAPSKGTIGTKLTVTGKITATVPLPAGVKLSVARIDVSSPSGKALASVTAKADGTFSFTDTPPAGGDVVYRVTYAGDAKHTSVVKSDTVVIPRTSTSLTLNNNGKVYTYGKDVTFTAHLGKTYSNRTVEIWANPFGSDKPNKLLKSGKVNSSGNISAVVDMKRDTTVTAVFKGDAKSAAKTVTSVGYATVSISNSVSGHYKTGYVGSHNYYWFRKTKAPLVSTTMSYYTGRKVRYDVQVYYNGTWYSGGSEYFKLSSTGKITVNMGAAGEAGIKARVRTNYINNSSGDNVNSTTYGSWKYLYFTN
ncbi:YncE family protein [Streptomyces abyssomicinicus]|uniref:YncE family protein n=1 Tax=Streptomyces abyssomicinicus TaxID=574929 RepID=UPI0012500DC2|nr:Ig-like domain repeat protein [Streptomyces abyssomicinicus]